AAKLNNPYGFYYMAMMYSEGQDRDKVRGLEHYINAWKLFSDVSWKNLCLGKIKLICFLMRDCEMEKYLIKYHS
ncbi:MAG: hypothetical protein Harvfovirus39_16, partial [Harvfovirus sp.]